MVHLVVVGDIDPMVFALDLASVQLERKGGDVRFWSVAPWREEVGFDIRLLLGVNNIPRADMDDHYIDCMVLVPYIVLLEFLDVFRVDVRDDSFDRHQVNHLLEGVLLQFDLLVRLEWEDLSILGAVLDYWVDELWFIKMLTAQVAVPNGRSHSGLAEDEP